MRIYVVCFFTVVVILTFIALRFLVLKAIFEMEGNSLDRHSISLEEKISLSLEKVSTLATVIQLLMKPKKTDKHSSTFS